jgi:hypothetical protein
MTTPNLTRFVKIQLNSCGAMRADLLRILWCVYHLQIQSPLGSQQSGSTAIVSKIQSGPGEIKMVLGDPSAIYTAYLAVTSRFSPIAGCGANQGAARLAESRSQHSS